MRTERFGSCSVSLRKLLADRKQVILITLILCASAGREFGKAAVAPKTVQTVQRVRHLTADALKRNPEVRIRGVVTYYDSIVPNLFVQDSSGGIWVDLRNTSKTPPQPGQRIDLSGQAAPGFTPYIEKPEWKVVGTTTLPRPASLTYEQARTGRFDSQWVEMDGVVRSFVQQAEGEVLVIDVVTPNGSFKVRYPPITPLSLRSLWMPRSGFGEYVAQRSIVGIRLLRFIFLSRL